MMKTAKEMFYELGYEEQEFVILGKIFINDKKQRILFFDNKKVVSKEDNYSYDTSLSMQELQAINKMCRELGWLDE